MPELPEVEVVRLGLADHAIGRRIDAVEVLHPRSIRRHLPGASDFVGRLIGKRMLAARRRGKYLWVDLDDESALLAHLGMSGQLRIQPPSADPETHLRVRLGFDDGGPELRFVDQRTFGGLSIEEQVDGVPTPVAHIGRDPLDPEFDVDAVVGRIRRRRTGIKRALLDQTLVSGIGNIYADEALWRARVHWARSTERLTRRQGLELLGAAGDVMTEALAAGGTSFDALYVDVNGASGYFDRSLSAYGQAGLPCSRCGTLIRRDSFMNRSSFSCPRCQPRPRRPHY